MSKTVKEVRENENGFEVFYTDGWSEQFINVDPTPYKAEAEKNKR